jgi:hypothetical protein
MFHCKWKDAHLELFLIVMSDQMSYVDVVKHALAKLTIVFVIMFITFVVSLFVWKNSLYFSIVLLIVSITSLMSLVMLTIMSTLTGFMLIIVYVGAMIVLIGYICAISPNLVLEPDYTFLTPLFLSLLLSLFIISFMSSTFSFVLFTLSDFYYSWQGVFLFITLVTMLFVTLLIVTSQHSIPRGPFRSLNV